jgi:hypothetical protein
VDPVDCDAVASLTSEEAAGEDSETALPVESTSGASKSSEAPAGVDPEQALSVDFVPESSASCEESLAGCADSSAARAEVQGQGVLGTAVLVFVSTCQAMAPRAVLLLVGVLCFELLAVTVGVSAARDVYVWTCLADCSVLEPCANHTEPHMAML